MENIVRSYKMILLFKKVIFCVVIHLLNFLSLFYIIIIYNNNNNKILIKCNKKHNVKNIQVHNTSLSSLHLNSYLGLLAR